MDKSYFDVKPKGRHAQAIAKPTADALMEFCRQEPEFEQAIEQSGKSFDDCLTAITKGIGSAISMPHDFMAMHTRLSEMIKYNASQEARRKFKENMEYRKKLEFAHSGLFIRQPKNMTEIVNEGKRLHHCVGGYAQRHAYGKLHIMFIRRAEKPDVPFYTVEVDLFGKIVQVRGLRNCETTPEVQAFIEEYEKHLAAAIGREKRRKTA